MKDISVSDFSPQGRENGRHKTSYYLGADSRRESQECNSAFSSSDREDIVSEAASGGGGS